ncbi:MAG: acetate--CoA ligase family protein [Alphaproteobacteria bacterium]
MAAHPLAPLLSPRSIAFVGASERQGSPGNNAIREALRGGFPGKLYPINPRYKEIDGIPCFPSLRDLPEAPDLAILLLANDKLEGALVEAVAAGVKGAVILDSCFLPGDTDPPLTKRLARIANEGGLKINGGNCTGFMNFEARARACAYPPGHNMEAGHVTFISHSGSTYGGFTRNERRLRFNLIVAPGQELTTTAAQYMDYALEMETTRAIGLMLEQVRDPGTFRASLEKAAQRDIPVVAIKLARSEYGKKLALSHSGALAGNAAAYDALFERYGVIRAEDIDEMVGTLMLFGEGKRAKKGGLAAVHDSGGERELAVDLAEQMGVPYAQISAPTVARLRKQLAPALAPVNPVDFYSTTHTHVEDVRECMSALLDDDASAMGMFFGNVVAGFKNYEEEGELLAELATRYDKPLAIGAMFCGSDHGDIALRISKKGVPVIYGVIPALKAARNLMRHRAGRERPPIGPAPAVPEAAVRKWRARLEKGGALDEGESLALLSDFGVPVQPHKIVETEKDALAAADALGYPAVLKTAMPGILHKSDQGGVKLRLTDREAVAAAYAALARNLGPRVLVAKMADPGVETVLGVVNDEAFGPLIMAGTGGILVEVLKDVRFALAPFDAVTARRVIDGLKVKPLLDGVRGQAPSDMAGFADALARLSGLAIALKDVLAEIDVNPFLVGPKGAVALDALVIPKKK